MSTRRPVDPSPVVLALIGLLALTGCQVGPPSSSAGAGTVAGVSGEATGTSSPSPPPSDPAILSITPATTTEQVRADRPVTVSLVNGDLLSVSLTDGAGATLAGETDDGGTWRNTDPLAPGTAYTVTATARGDDGRSLTGRSTFRTAKAARLISTTLIPGDDWVVGVGMPIIVVFSRPVTNRAAAEAAMSVTTSPQQVTGGWRWFSSTEAHWRPERFWPAGTKVTVRAATSGAELADGAWGKRTVTSRFEIGRSQIMDVDIAAHTLTMKRDGAVLRTIPVTTGKAGFRTRNGIKIVMDREPLVRMNSETTGIDSSDPEAYDLQVQYAMRLTWSGEYLHAAPWSVGSQGRANVSHGCTGMSTSNARWLFNEAQIGDVVMYKNGSRGLEWGNGYTDWNMPFDSYAGSS